MNLTGAQFRKFSDLVYRRSGIHLSEGKQSLLQARLGKRLRTLGLTSVNEYFSRLHADEQEMVDFLDAVSTNHTYFFRESHNFDCLCENHRSIWCAASSSGEEPYSLAVYCAEKGFQPSILATDISTRMLAAGEKGVYDAAKGKGIPPDLLRKYFQKGVGSWSGYIRVKERIRRLVTFKRFNLLTDIPPKECFDVILCRNVLIYFDRAVKEEVINRLYPALKGSGYFIVGGAESLHNLRHPYQYVAPSLYRKPATPNRP
ncbi:MAG: protein-glutamate O-methyltransferase CheR [Desulfobacterota bacterium]|jgi:chemotaxis protein methyltransferase CheR|nr:protein-glutamate O-methyltransferase CheR [Thermodesulfobacteriota bacterium]